MRAASAIGNSSFRTFMAFPRNYRPIEDRPVDCRYHPGMSDAIALTRSLLRFDTVNPPGRERDCAHLVGAMLQRSEEHTSQLQSRPHLVCRLLLGTKNHKLSS